jgi:glycogen synthase
MKVLSISTDYPPQSTGGYEQQCRDATRHLRAAGHRVRILSGAAPPARADAGEDVHRELPRFPAVPAPVDVAECRHAEQRAAVVLGHHLDDFAPDVLCLWRLGELSMSLPARAAAAGVPIVGVVGDAWMIDGPQRDPWSRRNGAPPLPDAAHWLFVSEDLRRHVIAAGRVLRHSRVVSPGVDLSAFPYSPDRPWRGRLLYLGRLSPLKGVDLAIEALSRLPDGTTLDIVGDGPPAYVGALRETARAAGVARRVRFHGSIPRNRLAPAYAAADAALFPVRWPEPFGLVPLEAMACGTPVVGVAAGGAAGHLRDGETALVVPPENPPALAAAVARLAAEPKLRDRLRRKGRRTAELYPAARADEAVTAALERATRA